MTKQKDKETLIKILAQLDVVEVKLNEVLKKFGADDEWLWDLGDHIFHKAIERLTEENRASNETCEQPELF